MKIHGVCHNEHRKKLNWYSIVWFYEVHITLLLNYIIKIVIQLLWQQTWRLIAVQLPIEYCILTATISRNVVQ